MSNGERTQTGGSSTQSIRAPGFIEGPTADAVQGATRQAQGTLPESFITSQARDLAGQTVRGDFLDPSTNPFLQQTFNTGADAIQNRLDSQFSGAGRNIGASIAPAKADLSSFANQLFGGNFQNERDRQFNAMSQSSQFDPLNQFIERMGPLANIAGKEVNSTFSQEQEHKASPLDRAASVLGAFF